ncbi:hypothetical protein Desdi_0998 [Desulfitobacterium dichloroeliminans LMG P-21439]|uniref:DUF3786 domain-containing protein n=1 Tax=Desulfitobacterium dichloroeliminans (strain LMG P-21439 / DCA1) TaxID=871963 RepID=L0F5T1_DESDL|nr:DUF3786 domain-containing protein [Desulfitobacterium dichloroeliminans]AGA68517.1 hypothetical protein Desdi_0998 [Desulfitobacterium dichloroeliminans LMG P-21439]
METNYRVAYDKFWQDIKNREPEEITSMRTVSYNGDTKQFVVSFFDQELIVDSNHKTVYRKTDGHHLNIMDAIIVLNYLAYAQPLSELEPRWVSIKEIPGGMIFYSAFLKTAISPLIKAFGHQAELLKTAGAFLGGRPAHMGNCSAVFKAFPEIPVCVVIWEGDEEVKANATILFDSSIEPMLHSESIIGLGISLATHLHKKATRI